MVIYICKTDLIFMDTFMLLRGQFGLMVLMDPLFMAA